MRVLLADVEGVGRQSIAMLLEALDGVQLVGQVRAHGDLAAALRQTRADVLVIDDRLLPADGHTLSNVGPLAGCVRVIVLGLDNSPAFAARAHRMGAEAWVAKERADEELPGLLI